MGDEFDETRVRPRGEFDSRDDFDETRVRPRGDFDETRVRPGGTPDGTRMLPPTVGEPDEPRWEARAAVPPAAAYERYQEFNEEPALPPDDRNWLRPLLFGIIGLLLLGVLLTGVWLIFTADDEPPTTQASASAAPSAPATTRTAAPTAPATTAPPSSAAAEPETVKVPQDLIGIPEAQARRRIEDVGLRVQVTRREDSTMAPGTVLEVEPGPGSDVEVNSVVRIVVATRPQPDASPSQNGGNG